MLGGIQMWINECLIQLNVYTETLKYTKEWNAITDEQKWYLGVKHC